MHIYITTTKTYIYNTLILLQDVYDILHGAPAYTSQHPLPVPLFRDLLREEHAGRQVGTALQL